MKKFITLISALVFTVALSTVAFAATKGWNKFDEGWKFSKNGEDFVACEFAKSGEDWFYLGEDELMLVNQVVEDNDNMYFVDATGKMVKNTWVFVAIDEDADEHWMFFGANGKAVKAGWKEIAGKKYHFTDSKMDYGFLAEDGTMIDEDNEDAYKDALYYCSVEEDGHQFKNEWFKTYDSDNDVVWLFFGSNGKKVTGKKVINGTEYYFNSDGKMMTSFVASPSQASPSSIAKYFDEDGKCVKGGWIWAMDEAEEDYHWYYSKNNGQLLKGVVKEINGKKYAFNSYGEMLTGFVSVNEDKTVNSEVGVSAEDIKVSDIMSGRAGMYMYFTENEDPMKQGAAYTGKSVIVIDGANVTIKFTSYGIAKCEGYKDVKGYLYCNDVLVKDYNEEVDYKYIKVVGFAEDKYLYVKTGKLSNKAPKKAEDLAPWEINVGDN